MKKFFTLIALCAGIMNASATDYAGKLRVVLNGQSATVQDATISVVEDNGKYTLTLNNFMFDAGEESIMPIGNIVVKDVEATSDGKNTFLKTKQDINITEGTLEGVDSWLGPILCLGGPIPVSINAVMQSDILKTQIDIPFGELNIKVVFDNRQFQIPNSDFENFHKATAGTGENAVESDEPNNWHSFMTATGMLAGIVSTTPHTFISEDVRPESTGSKSVLIKSGLVLGSIVANGTLTTGRLMAGGFSATDTKNNAFLDITKEDKDPNGDPYYTLLSSKPDAISLWVKFKQGSGAPAEYPYATITAAITDGSYYQEPVDKDYNDIIVAYAKDNKIESTGEWHKLTIPFDYATYTKATDPKAILVTISTNAEPGQGSDTRKENAKEDELYVDDLHLDYSAELADIAVGENSVADFKSDKTDYEYTFAIGTMPTMDEIAGMIKATTVSKEAYAFVAMEEVGKKITATILTVAADLEATKTYTVTFSEGTDGIENTISDEKTAPKEIYNMKGQKVASMKNGEVYIVKYADGKTVKVIKK